MRLLETYDAAETDGFPVKLPALPFQVGTSLARTLCPCSSPLTLRLPSPLLLALTPVRYWYYYLPLPLPLLLLPTLTPARVTLAVGSATVQADCHRHVPRR